MKTKVGILKINGDEIYSIIKFGDSIQLYSSIDDEYLFSWEYVGKYNECNKSRKFEIKLFEFLNSNERYKKYNHYLFEKQFEKFYDEIPEVRYDRDDEFFGDKNYFEDPDTYDITYSPVIYMDKMLDIKQSVRE